MTDSTSGNFLGDWLDDPRPPRAIRFSDLDRLRHRLQAGDVLLVEGRTRLDRTLEAVTGSPWTQVLLYLGRPQELRDATLRATLQEYLPCDPDSQLVLRPALQGGIALQLLSELQDEHLRLCRPRGLAEDDVQALLRYAISRLGVTPSLTLREVMALLMPWGLLPRRWRLPLFRRLARRTLRTLVGSTVGDAFSFIQYPVLPLVKRADQNMTRLFRRHPRLYCGADFDYSPYFDLIKVPFVEQHDERERIRLLPWKGRLGALEDTAHPSPVGEPTAPIDARQDASP